MYKYILIYLVTILSALVYSTIVPVLPSPSLDSSRILMILSKEPVELKGNYFSIPPYTSPTESSPGVEDCAASFPLYREFIFEHLASLDSSYIQRVGFTLCLTLTPPTTSTNSAITSPSNATLAYVIADLLPPPASTAIDYFSILERFQGYQNSVLNFKQHIYKFYMQYFDLNSVLATGGSSAVYDFSIPASSVSAPFIAAMLMSTSSWSIRHGELADYGQWVQHVVVICPDGSLNSQCSMKQPYYSFQPNDIFTTLPGYIIIAVVEAVFVCLFIYYLTRCTMVNVVIGSTDDLKEELDELHAKHGHYQQQEIALAELERALSRVGDEGGRDGMFSNPPPNYGMGPSNAPIRYNGGANPFAQPHTNNNHNTTTKGNVTVIQHQFSYSHSNTLQQEEHGDSSGSEYSVAVDGDDDDNPYLRPPKTKQKNLYEAQLGR